MSINLYKPGTYTGQAYSVYVGNCILYFSYNTLIGFSDNQCNLRRSNIWGPTTGKHMNYLGIKEFKEISEDELEHYVHAALAAQGTKWVFKI